MSAVYEEMRKAASEMIAILTKELNAIHKEVLYLTAEEMTMDLRRLYDKYIDDYYSYVTKYYYRHEAGRGTGVGLNLYRGDMISFDKFSKQIRIRIKGDEMAPYRGMSADDVLDMIGNGVRPMGAVNGSFNSVGWNSSYESEHFKTSATLNDAMSDYVAQSGEISYKIAKKYSPIVSAKSKYKYF